MEEVQGVTARQGEVAARDLVNAESLFAFPAEVIGCLFEVEPADRREGYRQGIARNGV